MATKYRCINVPEHVFDKLTVDQWCPLCDITTRPMLVSFEEEEIKLEESPKLTEEGLDIVAENPIIEEETVTIENEVTEPVLENPDFVCEEVRFGDQVWMKDFLSVDHFQNGERIFFAKDEKAWKNSKEQRRPAWCFAGFDANSGKSQGVLYNYYAVSHPNGLAPKGWIVPIVDDVEKLMSFAHHDFVLNHVEQFQNIELSYRLAMGSFVPTDKKRLFWTKTSKILYTAICFESDTKSGKINLKQMDKSSGFFVRCLKLS
jgi:uncharacterized protein (TIGR02145 family)